MGGWETLLAALGGLMLGIGLGVMLARRGERAIRRRMAEAESLVRTSVVPVLERRAETLGLPPEQRARDAEDAFDLSAGLAVSIRRYEESQDLPYTDTLEVDRAELARISRSGER